MIMTSLTVTTLASLFNDHYCMAGNNLWQKSVLLKCVTTIGHDYIVSLE